MKRILLYARDPGGANVILPIISAIRQKYEVYLYGKDTALKRFTVAHLPVVPFDISIKTLDEVSKFLDKIRPDFIITGTSEGDFTERYLWKAGINKSIPSFAILDQWINYGSRFSEYEASELREYLEDKKHLYMPTKILVMDNYAKTKMLEEGFNEEKILIAGQPHFEAFIKEYQNINPFVIEEFENKKKFKNVKVIVFVSEPIEKSYKENTSTNYYWGYTEKTIFTLFTEALDKLKDKYNQKIHVIIRLHPKEDENSYDNCLPIIKNISYEIDTLTESKFLICKADLICGMSSMFLIESVLCGKPITSIQIGLCRENPFVLTQKGFIPTILTTDDLYIDIERRIIRNDNPSLSLDIPSNAIENIIKYMEEYL